MSSIVKELRKDVERLRKSVAAIEKKLEQMDNDPHCDQSQVARYIQDKTVAEELLTTKLKTLKMEEYRENNKVNDEVQKKKQEEFDRKDISYRSVRSSYMNSSGN